MSRQPPRQPRAAGQAAAPPKQRNQPSAQALALLDVNNRPVTLPGKKGRLSEKTVLGVWFRLKHKYGQSVTGQIARRETYKWIRG